MMNFWKTRGNIMRCAAYKAYNYFSCVWKHMLFTFLPQIVFILQATYVAASGPLTSQYKHVIRNYDKMCSCASNSGLLGERYI